MSGRGKRVEKTTKISNVFQKKKVKSGIFMEILAYFAIRSVFQPITPINKKILPKKPSNKEK